MSTIVNYGGNTLANISNRTITLDTDGKWLTDNILIQDTGGEDGSILQEDDNFLYIDDSSPSDIFVHSFEINNNGIYTAPNGIGYNPVVINVDHEIEYFNRTLRSIDFTGLTTIGDYAFYNCLEITNVEIPSNIEQIKSFAFSKSGIENIIIPKTVTGLGEYVFSECNSLKTAEIYGSKTALDSYSIGHIFYKCVSLISVRILGWASGGSTHFEGCTSLTDVYTPKYNVAGERSFYGCTSLKTIALPVCSAIYARCFMECSSLEAIDFGQRTQFFRFDLFKNCSALKTIVLRGSTLTTLTLTSVFDGTPFASGGDGGTIYIPKVLYDELGTGSSLDYKAATNWSTFDGYGTITWAQIEGSQYENYYVDGRGVLQPVTKELSNCSISNDLAHYGSQFISQVELEDGYEITSVSITMNNSDITSTSFDTNTRIITIPSVTGPISITINTESGGAT